VTLDSLYFQQESRRHDECSPRCDR
jgi:hypothetical protein